MRRIQFNDIIAIESGGVLVPLAGIQVTVRVAGSAELADLYTTRSGATQLANPFVTEAGGKLEFWADPGDYDIEIEDTEVTPRITAQTFGFTSANSGPEGIPGFSLENESVSSIKIHPELKPSGTAGPDDEALRAIGSGPDNVVAGDDPRLEDERVPVNASVTAEKLAPGAVDPTVALVQPPMVHVRMNEAQVNATTVAQDSETTLEWNMEDYDDAGMFEVPRNYLACQKTGFYVADIGVSFGGAGSAADQYLDLLLYRMLIEGQGYECIGWTRVPHEWNRINNLRLTTPFFFWQETGRLQVRLNANSAGAGGFNMRFAERYPYFSARWVAAVSA